MYKILAQSNWKHCKINWYNDINSILGFFLIFTIREGTPLFYEGGKPLFPSLQLITLLICSNFLSTSFLNLHPTFVVVYVDVQGCLQQRDNRGVLCSHWAPPRQRLRLLLYTLDQVILYRQFLENREKEEIINRLKIAFSNPLYLCNMIL